MVGNEIHKWCKNAARGNWQVLGRERERVTPPLKNRNIIQACPISGKLFCKERFSKISCKNTDLTAKMWFFSLIIRIFVRFHSYFRPISQRFSGIFFVKPRASLIQRSKNIFVVGGGSVFFILKHLCRFSFTARFWDFNAKNTVLVGILRVFSLIIRILLCFSEQDYGSILKLH